MGNFKSIDELKTAIAEKGALKFKIKVSAGAKNNSLEFADEFIKVRVKAPAIEGKANKAIVEFLAESLDCAKSKVKILNGEKSSIKTVELKS